MATNVRSQSQAAVWMSSGSITDSLKNGSTVLFLMLRRCFWIFPRRNITPFWGDGRTFREISRHVTSSSEGWYGCFIKELWKHEQFDTKIILLLLGNSKLHLCWPKYFLFIISLTSFCAWIFVCIQWTFGRKLPKYWALGLPNPNNKPFKEMNVACPLTQ